MSKKGEKDNKKTKQMQQQERRAKQKKHAKLIETIKSQLNTEVIGDVTISYSFAEKQNQSKTGYNNRLFVIFHKDRIGYISKLEKNDLLPFQSFKAIPKLKKFLLLSDMDKLKKEKDKKEIVKIPFKKDGKEDYWELKCSSADLARSWISLINQQIKQIKNDQNNPARDVVVDESPTKKQKSQDEKSQSKSGVDKQRKSKSKSKDKQKSRQQIKKQKSVSGNLSQNKSNNQPKKPPQLEKQVVEQKKMQQKIETPQNQNRYAEENENHNENNRQQNNIPIFGLREQQKQQLAKPVSSLFVGGVSVSNEKDQSQLKSRMQKFQSMTSKIKQQYQRKKVEQKKIHEQVRNQSNQLLSNLLTFSTNVKLQIERMQRQWGYQFACAINEYEVIEKFKLYVEAVSSRIINQLGLEQKKRYYQPIDTTNSRIQYEINGVLFQVFLTQLKQISSSAYKYMQTGTIISNADYKMASHQFKNYDYVLRLNHNKGKIRIPLSMITHYKGFNVFAKVLIPSTQNYQNMDLLQKQLQILQAQSRIDNSIFSDTEPESAKILALQSKVYQKLARAQNSARKFDLCFIQQLKNYLPHDFNNFSKQRPYERLRWELIQDEECEDRILRGEDMCAVSSRLKIPQELRDGINQLTEIGKNIYDRIEAVLRILQSADQYFTNSKQLSMIIHKNGINMRYLGVLLERSKQSWLKQILMSQISARCAKKYLNFDLQECILNLNQSSLESINKFHEKQLIKFLNKMLGNSHQTQTFWKLLNRQSQTQYKVSINTEQINQQFLLQALQYHCCFKFRLQNMDLKDNSKEGLMKSKSKIISNINSSMNLGMNPTKSMSYYIQLFNSSNPFNVQHIACFEHRSKVYDLSFCEHYSSIQNILSQPTVQSFQQLKLLLNLSRTQIVPSHFKLCSSLYEQLVLFLSNWISPKQMPDLYHPQQNQIQIGEVMPSRTLYLMKLAEIRWMLKDGLVEDSEHIKQWILQHVNRWLGEWHPVLTQLYQLYANYFMMFKGEEKKAINYSKNAIRNQQKIIGINHQKMADSYYLLGSVYKNYGKKSQSINCYKKSKQIILKSNNEDSQAFGQVCLKMGQLYLSLKQPKQAADSGLQAMNILEKQQNYQSLIQAIELVCRCYQVQQDWQSYLTLIQSSLVHQVINFISQIEMLERIIKVCILPNLRIIAETNSSVSQKILKIMNQLPQTTRAPNMAYNFLKSRIEQKVFPHRFLQALTDIQQILEQIQVNGMLSRWKGFENLSNKSLLNKVGVNMESRGFNFIANLEAVNIFIGPSFIEGVLLQN